jgi:CRP-like cAMP-binding protein
MGQLTPPELSTLQRIGSPVKGLQRLRVGPREFQWLSRSLRAVDFFSNLKMRELDEILASISLFLYPADSVVILEGASDEGLYVLYVGRVIVSRRRAWRLFASPMKSLLPGDFFGEIALLERRPRTATVTTTEPSALFHLGADDFRFVLENDPSLARRIGQVADERKRELYHWGKQ